MAAPAAAAAAAAAPRRAVPRAPAGGELAAAARPHPAPRTAWDPAGARGAARGAASAALLGGLLAGAGLSAGRGRGAGRQARALADQHLRRPARAGGRALGAPMAQSARAASAARASLPWRSLERVYCVNLDRRPERWSFMQDQFEKLQLPVQRFSAVDGRTLDVPHLAEIGIIAKEAMPRYYLPTEMKLFGTDLTDGGIGCALSHMMIWKDILQQCAAGTASSDSKFLVIEDDCEFAEGFSEEVLLERLSHVPSDWELVYLGGQDLMHKQHLYPVGRGVRRLYKGFRETTAYVVNEAGAKACLEVCVPMYWQVDTHLNDESLREGLRPPREGEQEFTMRPRGYCLHPPIVAQMREGFPTDVQKVEHDA